MERPAPDYAAITTADAYGLIGATYSAATGQMVAQPRAEFRVGGAIVAPARSVEIPAIHPVPSDQVARLWGIVARRGTRICGVEGCHTAADGFSRCADHRDWPGCAQARTVRWTSTLCLQPVVGETGYCTGCLATTVADYDPLSPRCPVGDCASVSRTMHGGPCAFHARPHPPCVVDGCLEPGASRGRLCAEHFSEWFYRQHGQVAAMTPGATEPPARRAPALTTGRPSPHPVRGRCALTGAATGGSRRGGRGRGPTGR